MVINLELALCQCFPEIFQQLLFVQFCFVKRIVVIRNCLLVGIASGVRSHFCPVETAFNLEVLIYIGIHAHAQVKSAGRAGIITKIRGGLIHHLFIMFSVTAINQKSICLQTAGKAAGLTEQYTDQVGNPAKDCVAILPAVPLVDDMEMIDIHQDRIHGYFFITQVILLGVTVKIFPVIESCKRILFCRLDQLPVFCQFNGAFYPGHDDFR